MQTYIISFDIEGGARDDYDDLHEAIEKCSIEADRITESTWALVTEYTTRQKIKTCAKSEKELDLS